MKFCTPRFPFAPLHQPARPVEGHFQVRVWHVSGPSSPTADDAPEVSPARRTVLSSPFSAGGVHETAR
jgi:hypothetical protein